MRQQINNMKTNTIRGEVTMMMETIMSRSLRLVFTGGAALGIAMLAQPVLAQTTADDTSAAPVQRVEITGSNIRRVDAETPSPVQVITSDEMKKSGYTAVSDVLRNISANGAGQLTNSNSEAFAGGASGVALRGLSVGATLVLIDGHRMAPYPLADDTERQFTDISNIPFDAIDRIEVLKDGASAVYGSDAIAGVINVILKKSFKGTTVAVEGGGTQQGGGANIHASFSTGFGNLDEDGYSGYVALEYRHVDAILMSQRPVGQWNNPNSQALYGPNALNLTPGTPGSNLGGVSNPTTPYLYNSASTSPTASSQAANYYSYSSSCTATALANGTGCPYTNGGMFITPETENRNLLVSFTKRLADGWELNTKASIFQSLSEQSNANNYYNSPLPSFPGAGYAGAVSLAPGQIPQFGVGAIANFTVPANYPGNPFNAPATPQGAIPGVGYSKNQFDSNAYRIVSDLTGTIGAWDVGASLGYTKVQTTTTYVNDVNFNALYNALQLPSNNIGFFNLAGGNSPYVMNEIDPTFQNIAVSTLSFADVHASRALMALPGGDLGFATGVQFVHKDLNNPMPYQSSTGAQPIGFNTFAIGEENDASIYGELEAPVTKTLEVEGALRADHYDTYGTSVVPRFGFKWAPTNAFALRGTASEGFRAPNAAEVGNASSVFGLSTVYTDPILCGQPGGATGPGNYPSTCSFAPAYVQSTAAKLQPEKSKSWTLGTVVEPVKGWSSTIDYYSIDLTNQIVPAAELSNYVPNFLRGAQAMTPQNTTCPGTAVTGTASPCFTTNTLTPVGLIAAAITPYVNANATKTTGVELESHYKWKMGEPGAITVGIDWTHMLTYDLTANGQTYELAGTHGPNGVSGDTGNPKDRAQFTLGWDRGPLNVTTNLNYVGSYGVTDPSAGAPTCQAAITGGTPTFAGFASAGVAVPGNLCTVGSFMTMDLTTRYTMNNGWTLHAGILNLLGRLPPVDAQTYGGGFYTWNPALHGEGAIGRQYNLGASYHF
jgi:iron complex outermembrane receptor protein